MGGRKSGKEAEESQGKPYKTGSFLAEFILNSFIFICL
jgi:hypothetical protein